MPNPGEELEPQVSVDLPYWYSNDNRIGYCTESSTVYIYVNPRVSGSLITSTKLKSYVSTAFSRWVCSGKNYAFTNSEADADIVFTTVALYEANSYYLGDGQAAVTNITSSSVAYLALYGNTTKTVRCINKAYIYLLADDEYTEETYRMITVHEFGHALGYYGHYSSGSVMSSSPSSTYPNTNEIAHLSMVVD